MARKSVVLILAAALATAQELPRHGVIGLQVGPAEGGGVVVQRAIQGGAGEAAGFQPGDLIKTLDGVAISETAQFTGGIARHLAGQTVKVGIVRSGAAMTLSSILKARPLETSPYSDVIYTSVIVRGARRSVIVTRPRREGRSPAVLLMPGLGCYSVDNLDPARAYGRVIKELERAGYVTMRVEKTGEGDSEGPPCQDRAATPALEADGYVAGLRLLKSYDFVDAKKVIVFAHSMGPLIGSLVIEHEPVTAFVAVETVGKSWFEYDIERFRVQADVGGSPPEQVEERVREYERCSHRFYIEKQTPDELERVPGCHDFTAPFGGVPYTYLQAVADINLARQWRNADIPVLVIYGTSSPVTTADENRYLAALINRMHPGRAKYAEVPDMGQDFSRYSNPGEYLREARTSQHEFDSAFFDVLMPWLSEVAK